MIVEVCTNRLIDLKRNGRELQITEIVSFSKKSINKAFPDVLSKLSKAFLTQMLVKSQEVVNISLQRNLFPSVPCQISSTQLLNYKTLCVCSSVLLDILYKKKKTYRSINKLSDKRTYIELTCVAATEAQFGSVCITWVWRINELRNVLAKFLPYICSISIIYFRSSQNCQIEIHCRSKQLIRILHEKQFSLIVVFRFLVYLLLALLNTTTEFQQVSLRKIEDISD